MAKSWMWHHILWAILISGCHKVLFQLFVETLSHRRWRKPALKQTEVASSFSPFSICLHAGSDGSEGSRSPKFGLPRMYDKSYRISFSVVTPDLAYRLRRVNERREDEGRKGQCVHVWLSCEMWYDLYRTSFLRAKLILQTSSLHPRLQGSQEVPRSVWTHFSVSYG